MEELAARFRRFADRAATSPLYQQLALNLAEDPTVLRLASEARSVPATTLFFAAVHFLLLEGGGHDLRHFYADLTPNPSSPHDAYPYFRAYCLAEQNRIIEILHSRRTQTNEVRRCSYLALGFTVVASLAPKFSVIDVGASAGLHLLWRSYRYDFDGTSVGDPDSIVRLRCALRGPARPPIPSVLPQPISQVGIDLGPVAVDQLRDRLWLQALIWPEHQERAQLLQSALLLAVNDPPAVLAGNAFDLLPGLVAEIPPDTASCICHSHVLNQFSEMERSRFDALLASLAKDRDIYELSAEWIGTEWTEFSLSHFRAGSKSKTLLALVDDHGEWIRWSHPLL
jgi:hypothetical protein